MCDNRPHAASMCLLLILFSCLVSHTIHERPAKLVAKQQMCQNKRGGGVLDTPQTLEILLHPHPVTESRNDSGPQNVSTSHNFLINGYKLVLYVAHTCRDWPPRLDAHVCKFADCRNVSSDNIATRAATRAWTTHNLLLGTNVLVRALDS